MSRFRLHRTEAIVLKRHDFGEADRILTLYTPDRGKLHAIAKGVRRIASRKSGHIELFMHTGLLLADGRNLHVVTQAQAIQPYLGLRDDLVRTTYAYHIVELVDRFVGEGVSSPATFDLLRQSLSAMSECDDPSLVARFFELRLLGLLGYRPHLFQCASCSHELEPGDTDFSSEAGGVLCESCAGDFPDSVPLPDRAFRVLRFLQTREWALARRIALTPATRTALEALMNAYTRHLLERELKSVEFMRGLREMSSAAPPPGSTRAPDDRLDARRRAAGASETAG